MSGAGRHILHVRFHLGPDLDAGGTGASSKAGAGTGVGSAGPGTADSAGVGHSAGVSTAEYGGPSVSTVPYGRLLDLLTSITPRVQALPPDSADLDVTGALRFWARDPHGIAQLIRLRALALHGVRTTVATGPTRMIAAMAAAVTHPGDLADFDGRPDAARAFLRTRSVVELPGVERRTATTLTRYGLTTVGAVADAPLLTLQRILGAASGRSLHDLAHGRDARPVVPGAPEPTTSAVHRFPHDELDPTEHRRALLGLAGQLGTRLRDEGQAATALTLTVRYADLTRTVRRQALPEATGHTPDLARAAYRTYVRLGLQRARVIEVALRAERLVPADRATRQLLLDPADDAAQQVEAAADRARARFGPDAVGPAALAAPPQPES